MTSDQNTNSTKSTFFRKTIKRLIGLLIFVIILLLISLFCLNLYLASNKTKVLENLKFLNKAVITFEEANISVFKNFPSATISLNKVQLKDSTNRQGVPILEVGKLDAALTIGQLLKNEIEINAVALQKGKLNILIDKNGANNFTDLISVPSKESSANKSDKFQILTDDLLVTLEDMEIIAKDDLRSFSIHAQIGQADSQLKKKRKRAICGDFNQQLHLSI